MNYKKLIIIGAGGHGRAVAELATLTGYQSVFFLDDKYQEGELTFIDHHLLLGSPSHLPNFQDHTNLDFFVAIGNQQVRKALIEKILELKLPLTNLIHPAAHVSPSAKLSAGIAVMAGAVVGAHATIGLGAIINANATADHDTILKDFAHLGVGVQLAGGVVVEALAWMQAGSCAGYHVIVPESSVIPPGTALIHN